MPRINIEDDLETHPEFWRLLDIVKDRDACLGKLIRFFRLAQKRYGYDQELTLADLKYHSLEVMIESGWARPAFKENVFEVPNSHKHFDWYRQRVVAGGHSAKSSRKICAAPDKICAAPNKNTQSNKNKEVASTESGFRGQSVVFPLPPLTPSPSPTLTQENTILPDLAETKPRRVFDFEALYKKFPRKEGKQKGLLICKVQVKTPEDYFSLSQAIDRYAEHIRKTVTDPKYIKHFSTFMNSWRDWCDPDTGSVVKQNPTEPEWKRKAREEEEKSNATR